MVSVIAGWRKGVDATTRAWADKPSGLLHYKPTREDLLSMWGSNPHPSNKGDSSSGKTRHSKRLYGGSIPSSPAMCTVLGWYFSLSAAVAILIIFINRRR